MKVAIPTRNNVVDDHFGHCEYYTIFTISDMGEGAKHTLEDHHIRVIRGCSGSVEAVVNAWLQGALTDSGEACQHHDCPDHHDSGPLTFKVFK